MFLVEVYKKNEYKGQFVYYDVPATLFNSIKEYYSDATQRYEDGKDVVVYEDNKLKMKYIHVVYDKQAMKNYLDKITKEVDMLD